MALQTGTLMYFEITCTAFLKYIKIFSKALYFKFLFTPSPPKKETY